MFAARQCLTGVIRRRLRRLRPPRKQLADVRLPLAGAPAGPDAPRQIAARGYCSQPMSKLTQRNMACRA